MKKTLTCPKCEGRKLIHVERMKLPVTVDADGFLTRAASLPTIGGFETFICHSCGYTEWYADAAETIEPDEKLGIQLIDNTPKATLR